MHNPDIKICRHVCISFIIKVHNLDVLLISDAYLSDTTHMLHDGTAHAGTASIIKSYFKHQLLPEYKSTKFRSHE